MKRYYIGGLVLVGLAAVSIAYAKITKIEEYQYDQLGGGRTVCTGSGVYSSSQNGMNCTSLPNGCYHCVAIRQSCSDQGYVQCDDPTGPVACDENGINYYNSTDCPICNPNTYPYTCENGTGGGNECSDNGVTHYQYCEIACQVGSVLFNNNKCYRDDVAPSDKTPKAVVYDTTNRLAVGLSDYSNKKWMTGFGGYSDQIISNPWDAATEPASTNIDNQYYTTGTTGASLWQDLKNLFRGSLIKEAYAESNRAGFVTPDSGEIIWGGTYTQQENGTYGWSGDMTCPEGYMSITSTDGRPGCKQITNTSGGGQPGTHAGGASVCACRSTGTLKSLCTGDKVCSVCSCDSDYCSSCTCNCPSDYVNRESCPEAQRGVSCSCDSSKVKCNAAQCNNFCSSYIGRGFVANASDCPNGWEETATCCETTAGNRKTVYKCKEAPATCTGTICPSGTHCRVAATYCGGSYYCNDNCLNDCPAGANFCPSGTTCPTDRRCHNPQNDREYCQSIDYCVGGCNLTNCSGGSNNQASTEDDINTSKGPTWIRTKHVVSNTTWDCASTSSNCTCENCNRINENAVETTTYDDDATCAKRSANGRTYYCLKGFLIKNVSRNPGDSANGKSATTALRDFASAKVGTTTYSGSTPAANSCKNGWFLPSVNELNKIYNNKGAINQGLSAANGDAINSQMLWSSTQACNESGDTAVCDQAYYYNMTGGNSGISPRGTGRNVRCVVNY